ncbi:hypothetical protein F444_13132 [Phytophthora nicotianae P1976]|uniref:Uncharacterized protein n=1 Tax=Phytophthora nicotianae P1976 TaxID=1317066 RepID=A0A080ZUR1_PHYNI|nr:hypothetical protein F444_13132 [Phytophthora nicotianae P1976]
MIWKLHLRATRATRFKCTSSAPQIRLKIGTGAVANKPRSEAANPRSGMNLLATTRRHGIARIRDLMRPEEQEPGKITPLAASNAQLNFMRCCLKMGVVVTVYLFGGTNRPTITRSTRTSSTLTPRRGRSLLQGLVMSHRQCGKMELNERRSFAI